MENAGGMYIVTAGGWLCVGVSGQGEYGGLRGHSETTARASGLGVPGSVDGALHNDGGSFVSGAGVRELPALYPHITWHLWRPAGGKLFLALYFL